MKPRRLQFTTRSWFQWWVLPAIAVVTIGLSWSIYRSLRDVILRGFDQKLIAVSTTTAAFIDPDEHAELMHQPRITGMAFISDDTLLALDGSRNVLMRLRAINAAAEPMTVTVPPGLSHLAFDMTNRRLLALDRGAGRVIQLDPQTGTTDVLLDLGRNTGASALVATPDGEVFVLADRLLRTNLARGSIKPVGDVQLPAIVAAAYHPKHDTIFAIGADNRLLKIDQSSGDVSAGPALAFDEEAESLVYHPRHDALWAAGTQLVTIDPANGEVAPAEVVAAFGKELGPTYRRTITGMRRIMDELNLTYVYTQVVDHGSRITYGLDATRGDDHSPLHSRDELPAEQVAGVEALMRHGTVYASPVQQWQQWGLIKSAFAPIANASGHTIAMTGADVDVTLIEQRTRSALFHLLIVGALSLVLATAVSFAIADRLRRPLALIKSTALEVAAGNYHRRADVAAPREARVLAVTFNTVAAALETSLAALQSSIAGLLRDRDRYELGRRLSQPYEPTFVLQDVHGVRASWLDRSRASESTSGATRLGPQVVIWLAESSADRLEAARRRADLAVRVAARLGAAMHAPVALPADVLVVIVLDTERRLARVVRTNGAPAIETLPENAQRLAHEALTLELSGYTVEAIDA